MKCETTNTVLIFTLGVFVALDVLFALQTINRTREVRSLQFQTTQDSTILSKIQQIESIGQEAAAYNQKNPNPELTRILQAAQAKPSSK